MLNAQVLAVWTLCQAWAYEPATDSIIDTFFDPSMWPHELADGSMSLAWALKQASSSMELGFCDQNLFKLQLAFSHPHEGLGTETPWAGQ
jgi:hypothetical protein